MVSAHRKWGGVQKGGVLVNVLLFISLWVSVVSVCVCGFLAELFLSGFQGLFSCIRGWSHVASYCLYGNLSFRNSNIMPSLPLTPQPCGLAPEHVWRTAAGIVLETKNLSGWIVSWRLLLWSYGTAGPAPLFRHYNREPETGGLNDIYFSQFERLWSLRSRCQQIWLLVRALTLLGLWTATFSLALTWQGERSCLFIFLQGNHGSPHNLI